MLATGFIADAPEDGSIFPSAGGNSSDPAVQAIYWRCIAVLFYSARITNPDLRLTLFSNVSAPTVGGQDMAPLLERLGVECRKVALTARMPRGSMQAWGNVLYFLDILDALEGEADDIALALVDSDVVVADCLDTLFARTDDAEFLGYRVETPADEDVNGMTRRDMTRAASELDGRDRDTVDHYGGELLATRLGNWRRHRTLFRTAFERALGGEGAAGMARTEEHLYSIVFAQLEGRVLPANDLIKRIWTSARVNTARAGDERLALWHLPAEKRYGLHDLFGDLARLGWPMDMSPESLRAMAGKRCGIPRKVPGKIVHDGFRQVASKLGLRK